MKKTVIVIGGLVLLLVVLFVLYRFLRPAPERLFSDPLVLVKGEDIPSLSDDMQGALLCEAIDRHLKTLERSMRE